MRPTLQLVPVLLLLAGLATTASVLAFIGLVTGILLIRTTLILHQLKQVIFSVVCWSYCVKAALELPPGARDHLCVALRGEGALGAGLPRRPLHRGGLPLYPALCIVLTRRMLGSWAWC